jgi:hypothetical protein
MSMTPYEYSVRDMGSTQPLGNTAFKVAFASGYDPDYYANIQAYQGLNWDFFKTAGIFTAPNANDLALSDGPGLGNGMPSGAINK